MSATLTLVSTRPVQPIERLVIKLEALPPEVQVLTREIIAEALDNLTFIASQYIHYDDPLSRKLHQWCVKVITQFDDTEAVDKDYIEAIAKRIHQLSREILVNPMDQAPLLNPILVNDELPIWERKMWVDYQKSCDLPAQEGRIHEFARDVLEWRNELPIAELNPLVQFEHAIFLPLQKLLGESARPYIDDGFYALPEMAKKFCYPILKAQAVSRIDLQGLQKDMLKEASACRVLWESAKHHIAQMTAEIAERERQHTEMLKQCIINMETSYRNEANILKQHIDSLRDQLRETSSRLGASQSELASQAGQLRALRARMSELDAQNQSNRKKASRRGCIIS
jgi:Mg2+ and Co2+ transporter CorA